MKNQEAIAERAGVVLLLGMPANVVRVIRRAASLRETAKTEERESKSDRERQAVSRKMATSWSQLGDGLKCQRNTC